VDKTSSQTRKNLGVSNIGWLLEAEDAALRMISDLGFSFIEVAPTKIHPQWDGITRGTVNLYKRKLAAFGLSCRSMQSLFFGFRNWTIFDEPNTLTDVRQHLSERVKMVACELGARHLVFGSPRARRPSDANRVLSVDKQFDAAVKFFSEMAGIFEGTDIDICLEPNARAYGCDFGNTLATCHAVVKAVGAKHFRLHVDTGNMLLEGETISALTDDIAADVVHFHISEPRLAPISDGSIHGDCAAWLRTAPNAITPVIEMTPPKAGGGIFRKSLEVARHTYG